MKKTRFARLTALFLAVLTLCGTFGISAAAAGSGGSSSASTAQEIKELLNAASYTNYNARYPAARGTGEILLPAASVKSYSDGSITYLYDAERNVFWYEDAETGLRVEAPELAAKIGTFYGKDNVLFAPAAGSLTWEVSIPTTGRYAVEITYTSAKRSESALDTASSIERMFYIDGKVPFSQARYLSFSKTWVYQYDSYDENGIGQFRQDVNGNDLKPTAKIVNQWTTASFTDPDGFYQGPFEFYFDNGTDSTGAALTNVTHTITLQASREAMCIESVRVYANTDLKSYAEVLREYQANGYQAPSTRQSIVMQAEHPYQVSDTSVYAANDRTSAVTQPTSTGAQLLNVLGSNSYDTVGQWASYRLTDIPETGLYTISIRCKQDKLAGMYTSRVIRIGEEGGELKVPFQEAYNARFDYDKNWQIATLGDGTNVFQFYFEKGKTYILSLDVGLGELAEVIERVQDSLDVINNCYLEILKLTGPEPDQYRDYRFSRVMPATVRNLALQAANLTAISEELTALCGSKGDHVATLDKVAYLLEVMGTNEDKIAENLSNLKSYIGTLGTWLNTSKQQSLMMDYIVVSPSPETSYEAVIDPKLDGQYKANANFFESAGFEIASFFKSFFIDYNQMGVTSEISKHAEHVEVWLATGRDQASIWRNLIDSSFTSQEEIAVSLKLVTGGTLLPSVLAKQGPDVYMGLDSTSVINYAIRSAVLPVTDFVDRVGEDGKTYRETTLDQDFNTATLVPISMYGQLYGLPDAASFSMMFYRKDILANLGIGESDIATWDGLLQYVTLFQSSNMQVGLTRNYNMFLYQRGGDVWRYDGTTYDGTEYADLMNDRSFATYFDCMRVAYDSDVALDAFWYMCRFYTDYSFPVSFDAANRFRTGEMPIVISDAVGMYNQLTVFATEIRGLWMFTNVPGTVRSDGTLSDLSVAGVSAVVMMNNTENAEAAWKFMKWQVSPAVQASYGNDMVSLIGPSAKYNTANLTAVSQMSWTTEEAEHLLNQFGKLATIPNYPGYYIVDRYLNFAFLNAYNDGASPVEQLQGYVKTINKEIERKRSEFDLPTLGDGGTVDDSIARYVQYLRTLSDEELKDLALSDYVIDYIRNHAA